MTKAPHNEPAYAWVVVWGAFASMAVIFGVAYSFAAFFESFAAEFAAQRADVSLVFGLMPKKCWPTNTAASWSMRVSALRPATAQRGMDSQAPLQ